jgi:hypothetical protein
MGNAVASTIFCVRNTKKVENGDIGRVPVAIGQARNVVNSIMSCDNAAGKAANAAVDSFNVASKHEKLLKYVGKGVKFMGDNINPLIVAAAGIKVLTSDDKASAVIQQSSSLGAMFAFEGLMKGHLQGTVANALADVNKLRDKKGFEKTFQTVDTVLEKCNLKGKVGKIVYGVAFVVGSCTAYGVGEKFGNVLVDRVKKEGAKVKPEANEKAKSEDKEKAKPEEKA